MYRFEIYCVDLCWFETYYVTFLRTLYWNMWIDQYIEMNDRLCFRIMFVSLNIWVDSMVYLINRGWNLSLNKLIYDLGSNHANIFVVGWIRNDVDLKLSLLCTTMMNIERHLNKTSWNRHNIDYDGLMYDGLDMMSVLN